MEASLYGTPELNTAFINNIDLRWEMYPNAGEMVSVGVHSTRILKILLKCTCRSRLIIHSSTMETRRSTYSYGIEAEIRKSLASLGVSKFLRNTSVNLNASWIESEVNNVGMRS